MKWLYMFVAIFLTVNGEESYCLKNAQDRCLNQKNATEIPSCNATFSGFSSSIHHMQLYANEQLLKSFDYLLLSANFGTYVKNRPGFEKQFRALSDIAWERTIDLIKQMTKRGGEHNFKERHTNEKSTLNLHEFEAMAFALDTEKKLSTQAHNLHERYSHANHRARYDAEIAHYLEEKFIKDQATTIRKLSGYTNDLRRLLEVPKGDDGKYDTNWSPSLGLYMFDEYLQKQ